jgi:hypothetical protein
LHLSSRVVARPALVSTDIQNTPLPRLLQIFLFYRPSTAKCCTRQSAVLNMKSLEEVLRKTRHVHIDVLRRAGFCLLLLASAPPTSGIRTVAVDNEMLNEMLTECVNDLPACVYVHTHGFISVTCLLYFVPPMPVLWPYILLHSCIHLRLNARLFIHIHYSTCRVLCLRMRSTMRLYGHSRMHARGIHTQLRCVQDECAQLLSTGRVRPCSLGGVVRPRLQLHMQSRLHGRRLHVQQRERMQPRGNPRRQLPQA